MKINMTVKGLTIVMKNASNEEKDMKQLQIGIYGDNGHQITLLPGIENDSRIRIRAAAACTKTVFRDDVKIYDTLEEMLMDEEIELVSLCSPMRSEQAGHAIKCMQAGKHVYAEKPCAFTERELDEIIAVSRETGCRFHEMSEMEYKDVYVSLIELVRGGAVGDVVQIFTQKSYSPNLENRPQDENIDGGILLQVGIYNMRFAQQVTGKKILTARAVQTQKGNPKDGDLHTAVSFMTEHEDGVIGVGISNYCNPSGTFGSHGNESIRVFGTKGFAEITDNGRHWRLCTAEKDYGAFAVSASPRHYFYEVLDELLGISDVEIPLEEELHPVRMAIRAKHNM